MTGTATMSPPNNSEIFTNAMGNYYGKLLEPGLPTLQILCERLVKLHACIEIDIIDSGSETLLAILLAKPFDFGQVVTSILAGIDGHFLLTFRVFEFHEPLERETGFRFIKDMKQDDIVSGMSQLPERTQNRIRIDQQI